MGEVPAERRLSGWGIGEPWSRQGQPDPTLGATAAQGNRGRTGLPVDPTLGEATRTGVLYSQELRA